MSAFVVDENVPIVANDPSRISRGLEPQSLHVSLECKLAAIRFLRDLIREGVTVIDDDGLCVQKYRNYLATSGQPGVGDAFLRHVLDNGYNSNCVERVVLESSQTGYEAFPENVELSTFDYSDRIWVALALSSRLGPFLVNAADSDYEEHREALTAANVHVLQICGLPGAP